MYQTLINLRSDHFLGARGIGYILKTLRKTTAYSKKQLLASPICAVVNYTTASPSSLSFHALTANEPAYVSAHSDWMHCCNTNSVLHIDDLTHCCNSNSVLHIDDLTHCCNSNSVLHIDDLTHCCNTNSWYCALMSLPQHVILNPNGLLYTHCGVFVA